MFLIRLFILILFSFAMKDFKAQSKLVVNGGIINITSASSLVINDSNTNAITRTSGHIISEGENNKVIWNTTTTIGSYIIPFGYGATDYIPVSFTKTAGSGSGAFEFSTYRTATWQNSISIPSLVGHLNNSSGSDNSAKVVDRFWQMNAVNYTIKPDLTDVIFTYLDAEYIVASNTITESKLKAQRWNSTSNSWDDFGPLGIVDTASNIVVVSSILSADLYEWWMLVDNSFPLPVELVEFIVQCNSENVYLDWSTASEINNDYFSVERSMDAESWEVLSTKQGEGSSNNLNFYSFVDDNPFYGLSYYRLKQTDFNGGVKYSEIATTECENENSFSFLVYPNPSNGFFTVEIPSEITKEGLDFEIIDMYGKLIERLIMKGSIGVLNISSNPKGVYLLRVKNEKGELVSKKLVVQ